MFGQLSYLVKEAAVKQKKNPAILFLHGAGTRGSDKTLLETNPVFLKTCQIWNENSPFYVFAPQRYHIDYKITKRWKAFR